MSQQTKSVKLNAHQNANRGKALDNVSRTEKIRNKWNDSVRQCRQQKARLMQMKLAALLMSEPNAV